METCLWQNLQRLRWLFMARPHLGQRRDLRFRASDVRLRMPFPMPGLSMLVEKPYFPHPAEVCKADVAADYRQTAATR
jgi:hypothetical protein